MVVRFISLCLKHQIITILLGVATVIIGIWAWIDIRKEAYSDIADTQVRLIAKFPGRGTVEVEERVTLPIERILNAIPKVIVRRSRTINGLVVFQFVFEDGTDDYFARTRLLEKVLEADIPEDVTPQLAPMSSPVGEIYRYVLESTENHTPMELRTIQDWIVMPRMLQIQGIADVVTFGGLPKQFHVITEPDKLASYKIKISDIIDAVRNNNLNTGGNILQQGEQGFPIRSLGAIRDPKDIEKIVLKQVNGVPIKIKDIASVEISHPIPSGFLGYTLQNNIDGLVDVDKSVQGLVAIRRWGDPNEMGDRIKAKVDEINKHYLPKGVRLVNTYDRSDLVKYTISTVGHTLFAGVSIVTLVLIFFIGSVRSALVVVATIPVAMLFAFIMMKLTGIPASLLSLGAIDFGIIVDGSVVMVENILRKYRDATDEEKSMGILHFTATSAGEVGKEIFFSIAIIILAYLPIFSFERIEGRLFKPMAFTIAYAMLGSMIFSLTLIPVMMAMLYKKYFTSVNPGAIEWHNPLFYWLEKKYSNLILVLVRHSKKTILYSSIIVVIVVGLGVAKIGTEFLPELDEGGFTLRCYFPVGIAIQDAQKYTAKAREIIYKNKQVNVILSQLGRNDDGTDPLPPNRLEIYIGLKDYSEWEEKITKQELLIRLRNELEESFPGVKFSFSQPIMDNLSEAINGTIADLAVFVSGQDLDLMRSKANEILQIVTQIKGASEYGIEQEGNGTQLMIKIDRDAIARHAINVIDIQQIVEAAVGMQRVSTLYEGPFRFGIVVRFSSQYRATIDAIKNIPIISPTGERIPLSQLAEINLLDGPTMIFRQEGRRVVTVRTNVRGRDQGGFVAELRARIEKEVQIPEGYRIQYGGQYENLSRVGKQLIWIVPLTIGIIFSLLFLLYRNLKEVTVALACLPFSLIGGIIALMVRDYYFNVSAGVGFISLFGIATLSGVLFVSRTNLIIRENRGIKIEDAVHQSAVLLLRPILTTIVLALLGLMPSTVASGVGSDIQRPLATVIVGGLTTALFLVLTVLPSLYLTLIKDKKN